ncbi:MAG: asparaginase domain-containing protein [Clostridiales bacterium]|nr:asparaginase domain-containing protein [Clostridiales bacterium]
MRKILVVGTGGTIACVQGENIRLEKPFKIFEYVKYNDVEFDSALPFCVLSENMDIKKWKALVDYLNTVDFEKYEGVIILHGSDTLAYTGALLGNIFYDKSIILVASDKVLEDSSANGIANFQTAVEFILTGVHGVFISYNRLYRAVRTVSAGDNDEFYSVGNYPKIIENPKIHEKNILVIRPYVGIDYSNYNIDNADMVLHTMYHSATCPESVTAFMKKCSQKNVPFYFVTAKSSADYESSAEFNNIIFGSTLENAYAKALLTN